MAFEYRPHWPSDAAIDLERCRASVHNQYGGGTHQCTKRVKLPAAAPRWCGTHAPEAEAERRREAEEAFQRKWNTRRRASNLGQWAERDALPWLTEVLLPELERTALVALAEAVRDLVARAGA